MFDNPEKLFIILLIALFIFGPQKLIGLGASMGKAIREFRGHVRDAQEQFHSAVAEAQRTEEAFTVTEPPALPAPEPIVPDWGHSSAPAAAAPEAAAGTAATALDPRTAPAVPASAAASSSSTESAVEDEGPHSLASEPSSHAVRELLPRKT